MIPNAPMLTKDALRARAYYAAHRVEQNAKRARYYRAHRAAGRESAHQYRLRNPERAKACIRASQQRPAGRLRAYKRGAAERGLEFGLSLWDIHCFWKNPCHYCGEAIETVGLDRVDNARGYTRDNVVSCCRRCNIWKLATAQTDFLERARRIAALHP